MSKKSVIFIGGLTNGKIVFDYLTSSKLIDLKLVITYSDGAKKPRHVNFPDSGHILKTGTIKGSLDKIKALKPDLILVTGWSELLTQDFLDIPTMGVIGFHPSKLPYDRGRSVLAWQIAEGYTDSAVTMFYYNNVPDGGDIIGNEPFKIEHNDDINDILTKVDGSVLSLMRVYFPLIMQGINPRTKQTLDVGSFRRLRTSKDSRINWDQNAIHIYNLVRAISPPYPCAIGKVDGVDYKIRKVETLDFNYGHDQKPGTNIATLFDESIVIKTRDQFIRLIDYDKL